MRVSKANDVFKEVQLIVGPPSTVRELNIHDIFLASSVNLPIKGERITHLGSKSSVTSLSFWKITVTQVFSLFSLTNRADGNHF